MQAMTCRRVPLPRRNLSARRLRYHWQRHWALEQRREILQALQRGEHPLDNLMDRLLSA